MTRYLHTLVLLLAVLVLPSSCIKEDYDDCNNVSIYFQYLADGKNNVLRDYITKVDLYVFDEGGHIIGVSHYGEGELKRDGAMASFRLVPGMKYKMVAVGNAFDRTEVKNLQTESLLNKIFLQHPAWKQDGGKVDGHDHNYLGMLEFEVPGNENFTVYRDTVTLLSAHINVDVEINGLPAPDAAGMGGEIPYELRFEESNATTDFLGNVNPDDKGTCYPGLVYDKERNCYRTDNLSLFRMNSSAGLFSEDFCKHQLVLVDKRTGKELARESVFNYVSAHPDQIDLTKQEANLPIAIQFYDTNVEIKLPEWVIVGGKPEWN